MTRRRSALLWGLVGVMTFAVLVGGYRLVVGRLRASLGTLVGVAALVCVVVATVAYRYEVRLRQEGRT